MTGKYTMEASEYMEDLVAADAAIMWADIGLLEQESEPKKWEAKLRRIAGEYLLSSRFALMRILSRRISGNPGAAELPAPLASGSVTLEQARSLSAEDHAACMAFLLEMAGPAPEEDPGLYERILFRSWHDEESANAATRHALLHTLPEDSKAFSRRAAQLEKLNKKRFALPFTREEALQLGHILRFSPEEIQWYLMRVFDVEDGLRMNRANDLIEFYCFLTGASCRRSEHLKQQYQKRTLTITKQEVEDRSQNWTRQTAAGLVQRVEQWKLRPDTMEENFLSWLEARAPGLDIPSRSAGRVYRNLAAYAYAGALPREEALLDEMLHISDMDEDSEEALAHLYSGGQLSEEKCAQVSEQLYWENKTITDPDIKDNTKAWSVITTRKDRTLSASYGAINSSRTRIRSLLMGEEEVEKGDLLYLLWFTFNLAWSDTQVTSRNVIYDRIFDLKDAADALLSAALLPPFYPPHLLEQSMLLSVIYAGKTGDDPSAVYGSLLQSLRESRASSKKSGRHTLQEQIDIITHYRDDGMSLKDCALAYGISQQTISRWQKELTEQGHLRPGPGPK